MSGGPRRNHAARVGIRLPVLRRLLFPVRATHWLGPLFVAAIAIGLVAVLVVTTGWIDLSAREPHPYGWAQFLHYTFRRSTAAHEGPAPPADLDSPLRVAAGAAYYGQACAHCHAGPGLGQNPVALSMHPRPQFLARDLVAARFSPRELFRIVDAGVKYSAMPGWPANGREDEVWHMVAFLRALPRLTPAEFRALTVVPPQPARTDVGARAFGPPVRGQAYRFINADEPPVASFNYRWPVLAFGSDVALSGDPVTSCVRCHGADGRGGGAFPNLTIQDATYLRNSLRAYAEGRRESGFMRVMASQLSPAQIDALAGHYAALPRRAADPPAAPDPLGQRLALAGDKATGLGPCAGCHGVTRAAAKAYPLLEGQSAWYIANQMRVFAAGGRGGIEGENPMPAIAKRMSERQIQAVARYYAGQAPAARQSFAELRPSGRAH